MLNITRKRLKGTNWRSKRYSAFSTRLSMNTPPAVCPLPARHPLIPSTPLQPPYLRAVRPRSALSDLAWDMFLNFNTPACGRLIRRAFAPHELPSLIEVIFSGKGEGDAIRCLPGDDAQIFVDVIDEVRPTYVRSSPRTR